MANLPTSGRTFATAQVQIINFCFHARQCVYLCTFSVFGFCQMWPSWSHMSLWSSLKLFCMFKTRQTSDMLWLRDKAIVKHTSANYIFVYESDWMLHLTWNQGDLHSQTLRTCLFYFDASPFTLFTSDKVISMCPCYVWLFVWGCVYKWTD